MGLRNPRVGAHVVYSRKDRPNAPGASQEMLNTQALSSFWRGRILDLFPVRTTLATVSAVRGIRSFITYVHIVGRLTE